MNIELTTEQKRDLEAQHRKSRDCRIRDRIRCVLLSAQGWSAATIAKSQLIDETTVRRHLNDWLNERKLKPENGGSDSHLSEAQTAELIAHLTDNLLPTTQVIIECVDEWWGIRYTVPGMNNRLHNFCQPAVVNATEPTKYVSQPKISQLTHQPEIRIPKLMRYI